jgi:hypothetical protein
MSDSKSTGRAPSEAELLEWMKIKPRTFGWDAWLAYDRTAVNQSLWRDYIARADSHPFAGTVSGEVEIEENLIWEHLYDVRLAAPQISFEQSGFNSPRVTLHARAISGTQLSVESFNGPKQIVRVYDYSPLLGPRLQADAFIDDNDNAAQNARQVRMDLASAEKHRFSFSGVAMSQDKGGDFFHEHFVALPQKSQHCLLNILGEWERGALVPETVRPRPLPILDAEGKPTPDGAVLLMVAATGSDVGDHPDVEGDWKYPIPEGHHASLWIGSHCLMKRIIEPSIRGVSSGAEFSYDSVDDPTVLTVTKGTLLPRELEAEVAALGTLRYMLEAPLSGDVAAGASFEIGRAENGLVLNWKTSTFASIESPLLHSDAPAGTTALDCAWRIKSSYEYFPEEDGTLRVRAVGQGTRWYRPVYRQAGVLDQLHYQHFPAVTQAITEELTREVDGLVARMAGGSELGEIDRLRFEGLQCPGDTGMALQSAYMPRDLALFGTLAARAGTFVISPTEDRVLAGGTLQFKTQPAQAGLEWRVEVVAGSQGTPGTISASGLYTAPAAASIDGSFVVVKVTAAGPTHSSTAWISVLTEAVALNPSVFAAVTAGAKVRLSAGSLGGGKLNWSLTTATGATLEEAVPETGLLLDPDDRLYIRGSTPTGNFFSVDEVSVTDSEGATASTPILVVEKDRRGAIVIREGTGLRADQIQLDFDGGTGTPVPEAEWTVQIGGGSITQSGLYTYDPDSPLPYVVITAEWEQPLFHLGNFIILPIPLVELDDVKRALA